MSFSPLTFTDLPTELKCRIMHNLSVRCLLRLSMTSKLIHNVIYASEALVLGIEMAKYELMPMLTIRSTPTARKFLKAHVDARLNLPMATRPCVTFPAPEGGIHQEKLFRGIFTCVTGNDMLHVWNIRSLTTPKFVLVIPNILDVAIEPDLNLLVVLCADDDNDRATIRLLQLGSRGTQPHPWAASPLMIHTPLPDDSVDSHYGQHFLTLRGDLLALVYNRDSRLESRRGIIWNWITGKVIYDSMDFSNSSDFHDLLLLPTVNFFLVTVSSFLIDKPGTDLGAWIELRHRGSTSSRLVAEFHLPEFRDPAEHYLGAMDFYSSQPPICRTWPNYNEDIFPFVSDLAGSVHVLHIWYKCRPDARPDRESASRIYLIISNIVVHNLAVWSQRDDLSGISFPIHKAWDDWAPWWTTIWRYENLGLLSGTSSVCGSRICTVMNPKDGEIELLVLDFNMKIPCNQRICLDPLEHFYPRTIDPGDSPWARIVRTWLPFHEDYRRFKMQAEGDKPLICSAVLMDEERIVLSTCPDEAEDVFLDPTSWKVVHLTREPTALGINCFTPVPDDDKLDTRLHDQICRMCKEKPHTDAHILLECTANPTVVDLRRNYLADIEHHNSVGSFDGLFKEIMARRDAIRMPISLLVEDITWVYENLPECSELIPPDQENPASTLFTNLACSNYRLGYKIVQ